MASHHHHHFDRCHGAWAPCRTFLSRRIRRRGAWLWQQKKSGDEKYGFLIFLAYFLTAGEWTGGLCASVLSPLTSYNNTRKIGAQRRARPETAVVSLLSEC